MRGVRPELEILQSRADIEEHHPFPAADPTFFDQLNLGGQTGGALGIKSPIKRK